MAFNVQESAYRYARQILFDAAGVSISIKRGDASLMQTRAILAQTKDEDADATSGQAFANFVDVLVFGSTGYRPQTGDVVEIPSTGEAFVVRPIASNLYRWDDPYRLVLRFYAQRRAVATNTATEAE